VLLRAVVLFVMVAALARVVLPDSNTIVLEHSIGAHVLGTTAPTVTAALLA
jgi:hypothetical protein